MLGINRCSRIRGRKVMEGAWGCMGGGGVVGRVKWGGGGKGVCIGRGE